MELCVRVFNYSGTSFASHVCLSLTNKLKIPDGKVKSLLNKFKWKSERHEESEGLLQQRAYTETVTIWLQSSGSQMASPSAPEGIQPTNQSRPFLLTLGSWETHCLTLLKPTQQVA